MYKWPFARCKTLKQRTWDIDYLSARCQCFGLQNKTCIDLAGWWFSIYIYIYIYTVYIYTVYIYMYTVYIYNIYIYIYLYYIYYIYIYYIYVCMIQYIFFSCNYRNVPMIILWKSKKTPVKWASQWRHGHKWFLHVGEFCWSIYSWLCSVIPRIYSGLYGRTYLLCPDMMLPTPISQRILGDVCFLAVPHVIHIWIS